jgi:hypothetical protein
MKPRELETKVAERQGYIREELIFQYDNLFHVLSVTIRPLSHKQWTTGATPARTPVRQACHIARACDAYATQEWDICEQYFGIPVHSLDTDLPRERLPTTEQVLAYIDSVREHVHDWLGSKSNEDLLAPTPNPGWSQRGWTMLGHTIYVLRHGTLHLGHLQAELKARGIQYGVFK